MVRRIAAAVELPVTMDLEAGYGDPGATAHRAIEAGIVGGNLEDQMKPLDEAVAAVEAVLAAGRDAGIEFVLNARTDAFVRAPKGTDRGKLLQEALRRGRAFLEAGAPVVFVPARSPAKRSPRSPTASARRSSPSSASPAPRCRSANCSSWA